MTEDIKEYENEDIKILWKPNMCIHSKLCWHDLSTVFNPNIRPWINPTGATTDSIKSQIDKCPSGALSYIVKNMQQTIESRNEEIVIEVKKNGPLVVHCNFKIQDEEGNITERTNKTSLCRCGASANKPYCDGTHRKIEFEA